MAIHEETGMKGVLEQVISMSRTTLFRTALLGFAVTWAAFSSAEDEPDISESMSTPMDEILLKNGSRILGTVTKARDGVFEVDTEFAGTISIDRTKVESLNLHGSLTVLMEDGSTIRDQAIFVEEAGITVTTETGDQRTYAAHDVSILDPEPWELGVGYKFSGLVNVSSSVEKGNSDTDEIDYKAETVWRSLRDRYTVKMHGELDEANGTRNVANTRITGKYDYFLEGDNYWGIKLAAKKDEFADLDLRAYIGPYYGRQFHERRIFTFSGEVGVTYVTEDFIVAESQQYPGAQWEVNLTSDYLGLGSRLYVEQGGIWNLKEREDIILNTTLGVSIPLLGRLEAAAEIFLEYDSGAVKDVEELDQTYKLRIGYTW
jgi:hypothetical protein